MASTVFSEGVVVTSLDERRSPRISLIFALTQLNFSLNEERNSLSSSLDFFRQLEELLLVSFDFTYQNANTLSNVELTL
jgi:hypothetical protein